MTAASAMAEGVSRTEFDALVCRTAALEQCGERAAADFVRQGEFRLFKWVAAFAVASMLGGFGVLYQMTGDLQVSVERGFGQVHERLGRIETQLEALENRVGKVEVRLDRMDERSRAER